MTMKAVNPRCTVNPAVVAHADHAKGDDQQVVISARLGVD